MKYNFLRSANTLNNPEKNFEKWISYIRSSNRSLALLWCKKNRTYLFSKTLAQSRTSLREDVISKIHRACRSHGCAAAPPYSQPLDYTQRGNEKASSSNDKVDVISYSSSGLHTVQSQTHLSRKLTSSDLVIFTYALDSNNKFVITRYDCLGLLLWE